MTAVPLGRGARVLALLSLGVLAGGCRKAPAPTVARHFVRIETLLPLHPAWTQVMTLDKAGSVIASDAAASLSLPPAIPQPANFSAPTLLPGNLEAERRQRIRDEAKVRIRRLTDDLQRHNADVLRNERESGSRALAARIANAKAQLAKAPPSEEIQRIQKAYAFRILNLGYKEVAYLSQLRVYTGPTRAESLRLLQEVRAEIKRLRAERDEKIAAASAVPMRDMSDDIARWTREFEERMTRRAQELADAARNQIAAEEASLQSEVDPIPPMGSHAQVPTSAPTPPQLPAALDAVSGQVASRATQQTQAAQLRERNALASQKARLIASIRTDIANAVLQAARRQGWRLVPEGTAGATDYTDTAAEALRAQWRN